MYSGNILFPIKVLFCGPCNSGNYLRQARLLFEKDMYNSSLLSVAPTFQSCNHLDKYMLLRRTTCTSLLLSICHIMHIMNSAYNEFDDKGKKYIKILNHSNSERSRKHTRLEECKRHYPRDLWIVQKCTLVWEALCDKAFRL